MKEKIFGEFFDTLVKELSSQAKEERVKNISELHQVKPYIEGVLNSREMRAKKNKNNRGAQNNNNRSTEILQSSTPKAREPAAKFKSEAKPTLDQKVQGEPGLETKQAQLQHQQGYNQGTTIPFDNMVDQQMDPNQQQNIEEAQSSVNQFDMSDAKVLAQQKLYNQNVQPSVNTGEYQLAG